MLFPSRLAACFAATLPVGIAAGLLLTPSGARAQDGQCPEGSRFIELRVVTLPDGRRAEQPICLLSTRVHLWLKAFIPNAHPGNPGYVVQTAAGTTAIPAPLRDVSRFLGGRGRCFATDERLFDPDPRASARITVEFDLIVENDRIERIERHGGRLLVDPGRSSVVDCTTGEVVEVKRADNRGIAVNLTGGDSVTVRGGIGNPFYAVSPTIDMYLTVSHDAASGQLRLAGQIGVFPAFEAYYSVNGGPAGVLSQLMPAPGTTANNLFDALGYLNMRAVEGTISLPR